MILPKKIKENELGFYYDFECFNKILLISHSVTLPVKFHVNKKILDMQR